MYINLYNYLHLYMYIGADVILDFVGASYWENHTQCVAVDGRIVLLGLVCYLQLPYITCRDMDSTQYIGRVIYSKTTFRDMSSVCLWLVHCSTIACECVILLYICQCSLSSMPLPNAQKQS